MKGIILSIVFLCLSAFTVADNFDLHCADIAILQDRNIQNDIGVTATQRDRMNKFADANRVKLEAYQKQLAGKQPDFKVINQFMYELKLNVQSVMTPAQLKRLRELNLQAIGLLALLDPTVSTRVGMSDVQAKKFRQTYMDGKASVQNLVKASMLPLSQKYQKLAAPYKGHEKEHEAELKKLNDQFNGEAKGIQQRIQPQMQSLTQRAQSKLAGMLTPQQKATWVALLGKRFVKPAGTSLKK